ncbi:MAG: hypothetical protein ACLPKB_32095 [Xanthobacteraceae bacterium]
MPEGEQWAHEIKHDGYRMICRRDGDRVRVFSRHGREWTDTRLMFRRRSTRPQQIYIPSAYIAETIGAEEPLPNVAKVLSAIADNA